LLVAGSLAPPLRLLTLDGQAEELAPEAQPLVIVFFKISCPTCQLSFPYLERLHQTGRIRLAGVSQNDAASTREFAAAFCPTLPIYQDAPGYPASNAYAITHVPSVFEISPEGVIREAFAGFSKDDFTRLALRHTGQELFRPTDRVPIFKPG
jgi:thiol-disulfide isomerase/thioredoxin